MTTYVVFSSVTGVIDGDCPVCGINSTSHPSEFKDLVVPPGHEVSELKGKDIYKIQEIDQTKRRFKHKISKVSRKPIIHV